MIDRNEEIIKIATVLFSENGYDNTSTRELAKAVDLSVAGIYYFFQNKEEILFTILNTSMIDFLQTVQSAINTDDNPQTNISRIIDCVFKYVVEYKMEIVLSLKERRRLSPEQLVIIKKLERDVFILIRNEIERLNKEGGLKDLNLSFLTFALLGMINYSHYWFDSKSQLTIEDFVAQTTELFYNGVLKSLKE